MDPSAVWNLSWVDKISSWINTIWTRRISKVLPYNFTSINVRGWWWTLFTVGKTGWSGEKAPNFKAFFQLCHGWFIHGNKHPNSWSHFAPYLKLPVRMCTTPGTMHELPTKCTFHFVPMQMIIMVCSTIMTIIASLWVKMVQINFYNVNSLLSAFGHPLVGTSELVLLQNAVTIHCCS